MTTTTDDFTRACDKYGELHAVRCFLTTLGNRDTAPRRLLQLEPSHIETIHRNILPVIESMDDMQANQLVEKHHVYYVPDTCPKTGKPILVEIYDAGTKRENFEHNATRAGIKTAGLIVARMHLLKNRVPENLHEWNYTFGQPTRTLSSVVPVYASHMQYSLYFVYQAIEYVQRRSISKCSGGNV